MVTQHQSQCQQHGPLSEPALTVTSVNIEGMSAAKRQLLTELCEKQKCNVLCVQETHQGLKAIRPNIRGMSLVAEIPHEQYGSAIFVRNNCICDSTSTSNTNNVEIIQAQLNKLTVMSVYKPPNEQFSFGSNLASTQMNVVIGYIPPRHITSTHYKTADTDIQHCIQYITNIPHSVLTRDMNSHSTLWHSVH